MYQRPKYKYYRADVCNTWLMKYQRPETNRKDAGEDVQVKEEREPGGRDNGLVDLGIVVSHKEWNLVL